jgi:Holliday junction resolvase RusA-like endonuclease
MAGTFEQAVAVFANGQTLIPAESSLLKKIRYGIDLTIVLDKKQRLDLDNAPKCAIDSLVTCGVIHSDAAVVRLTMTKYRDPGNPRTEFVVFTI